jgi:probable O-glycosylation ligase (exosortase A-associated)
MTVTWALFACWLCVTTVFALNPDGAYGALDKSLKIQISSFIILMVMTTPWRLKAFVAVVTLSIAFYGIKGGIFTILGGGMNLVWGPVGSFIADNNALAMALLVILPLLWYLRQHAPNKWIGRAMSAAIVLCTFSIVGSSSRGAFLGLASMGLFLVLKSRRRIPLLLGMAVLIPVLISFAPQKYWDRISTIETYEEDTSAMGRIHAWQTAINMARDRPVVGGGFEAWTPQVYARYAPPETMKPRDVHSMYFEILGEQGFVGLALYLALLFMAYRGAGKTVRRAKGVPGAEWQLDLASMVQVSLVGYGTAGAFLGLAYFDLLFNLYAMVVLNRLILERKLVEEGGAATAVPRTAPVYGQPSVGTGAADGSLLQRQY